MPKKTKELSTEDQLLLSVTEKPSSKKKKGKKKKVSDSEDDLSPSDSDTSSSSEGEVQKIAESQKPLKKRKQNNPEEVKVVESDEDEFDDGYDENLYENEEDRERLDALPELEREAIIDQRYNRRKELLDQWELRRKMKATPSTPGSRSSQRSKQTSKKIEKAEAFLDMKRRREKSKPEREKYAPEESSDSEPDEEEAKNKKDESSDDEKQESMIIERDPDEDKPIALEQAKKLCLKREFLEKIVHEAFFDKVVPGLFVRIGIGASVDGKPTYRMAEISNAQDGEKIYQLGKKATTKLLELKIGSDKTRKVYSMETISNHSLSDNEFLKWCEELKRQELRIMSVAEAKRRFATFIDQTRNHTYDHNEVDQILQKKKELNILPTNFSQRVKELEYELRIAMDEVPKNAEKIQQIQKDLDDARAKVKIVHSKTLESMTKITQRNKSSNQEAKPYEPTVAYADAEKDPFSRRRTNPIRIVLKKDENSNQEKEEKKEENAPLNNDQLEILNRDKLESGPVLASFVALKNPEFLLKEAHDFDLDIPLGISPSPMLLENSKKKEEIEPRKAIPKRYILSIDDYKHRIQVATGHHH